VPITPVSGWLCLGETEISTNPKDLTMKKNKQDRRLSLARTTIVKLDGTALKQVNGGVSFIKIGDIKNYDDGGRR
jgi:hypothetical protein